MIDDAAASPTTNPITLELVATEADWLGVFDQLEVWRSRATAGGPFEELTAADWMSARLPVGAEDAPTAPVTGSLVNVAGQQLDLLFRERDAVSLVLAGTNPLTYGDVAQQITTSGRRLVRSYVTSSGELVLETFAVGTTSVLRVVGGEAAATLGLPTVLPDSQVFGRDARLSLVHGQEAYRFIDGFGSSTYWYRLRFRNRLLGTTSEFTPPFQVGSSTAISATNLVAGYLDLVDLEGKAIANRDVRISRGPVPILIDGALVGGRDESRLTDTQGHCEFVLVRGQATVLTIAGTDIVVTVLPPTDPSIHRFNLLDTTYLQQDDYFKARVTNIPFAARRTL